MIFRDKEKEKKRKKKKRKRFISRLIVRYVIHCNNFGIRKEKITFQGTGFGG